jgi:tRNA-specific 2-thiouridylase
LGERPGEIVGREGAVVGTHDGTYGFTIGQRKGLGVSGPEPLYVTAVDPELDRVVVGTAQDSAVTSLEISGITWHAAPVSDDYSVQIRSSGASLKTRFASPLDPGRNQGGDHVTIYLEEPVTGVAAGQTAVVYDGPTVVMAGTISAAA